MKEKLDTLHKALDHVCELMECYRSLKGKTEFAELISDYRYAALVAIQSEVFYQIREIEKTRLNG